MGRSSLSRRLATSARTSGGACCSPRRTRTQRSFPRRFDGRFAALHRPVSITPTHAAHIWISWSPDLRHWGDHRILLRAREGSWWDAHKVGLCAPPLLTEPGMAASLPRRSNHRGRLHLSPRARPPRHGRSPSMCSLDRTSGCSRPMPRMSESATSTRSSSRAAGDSLTTATRFVCTTAQRTPRSASRPQASPRFSRWLARHSD